MPIGARFFNKMLLKKELCLIFCSVVIIFFYLMTRPFLFFVSDANLLLAVPASPKSEFSIHFIHSVQKTPVLENLMISESGKEFILLSTKYQSFGVGLPFLLSEGDFHQENDYFIFDNINRHFDQLTLRTGLGTKLTIIYKEHEYPIYKKVAPGSKVDLQIAPYYKRFM